MNNDLISREALITAIEDHFDNLDAYFPSAFIKEVEDAPTVEERPQGEYVPISKLRLMTVEECAGHTIEYAMGWKACIDWLKKGGADNEHL